MGSITLDERDTAVLRRLSRGDADVATLATDASRSPEYLRDRLPDLADNGLVERVGDDAYAITANGERALVASPAGTMDDRIDTPAEVERAIENLALRPDRAAAVRAAYAFLHYWGEAVPMEVVDAVYSEHPAGFASGRAWWTGLVGDSLAGLPGVDPSGSDDEAWRYAGTPTVAESTADGRLVAGGGQGRPGDETPGASVTFALARADLTDEERAAVRAAFAHLARAGEASADAIAAQVYPDHDAGYDAADEWWTDCVRDALASLPGVERVDEERDVWRYAPADAAPTASDAGGVDRVAEGDRSRDDARGSGDGDG